jgi:general secretion pathway protein I
MSVDFAGRRARPDRALWRGEAGFTLLEVIVAVAIAGLALVALFQAGSAGLLTVSEATRVEAAVDRAQSHLAEFASTSAIRPEESEGDDGDGYHWRLTARPVTSRPAETPDRPDAAPTLYDIDVTIWWGTGHHRRSVELETERIGNAGTPQ